MAEITQGVEDTGSVQSINGIENTVVGSITDTQGTLVLFRASGEQVDVRPDGLILLGDMLYASGDGEVTIRFVDGATSSTKGFGVVKTDNIILFSEASLLDIDGLLADTDIENPAPLDFDPSLTVISRLNELLPTAAGGDITTAEVQSRSQTVIDYDDYSIAVRHQVEALPSANPITSDTDNLALITPSQPQQLINIPNEDPSITNSPIALNGLNDSGESVRATAANTSNTNAPTSATEENITVSATVVGGDIIGSGAEDAGSITGTLTATDADGLTDGTLFSIGAGDGATYGVASIDPASGAWIYTPNLHFNGTDTFTVTITDDVGNTSTQVITATVTPVDDPVTLGGEWCRRWRCYYRNINSIGY